MEIKEDIYVSDVTEQDQLSIVIKGDEHTVWAYLMKIVGEEHHVIFHGFLCSRGTIVDNPEEVEEFLEQDLLPPLIEEYSNEFSIQMDLKNENFEIEWDEFEVRVYIKTVLYLVINYTKERSFSKAISKNGPYGYIFDAYDDEV